MSTPHAPRRDDAGDPGRVEPHLTQAFQALEVPPGFRAELVDGEIVVSPPNDGQHEKIILMISSWLLSHHDLDLYRNITVITPEGEYVPDGIAAPKGTFDGEEWRFVPETS